MSTHHLTRPALRRLALAVTAGAGALTLLTACGGDGATSAQPGDAGMTGMTSGASAPATSASPAASTSPANGSNAADVMFAQMMIPHHRQAVAMAELAETRAADPEVKDLAAKIKGAQDPEIATMSGWLKAWGAPEMPDGGHMGHDMPGMMSEKDMAGLKAAKGAEFDRMFAKMMIAHHEGAVGMAETERAQGADPAAKRLAADIIAAQQAEIKQMRKLLDRL
ncbi:DUF305 domain-containing protein [Streptosporangium sandarakinum]|uniref:DUF305 domain-containing protein n=1 Tax=Streptosporangium sandarakinum TaxID=1260955 RepID=UPI0034355929